MSELLGRNVEYVRATLRGWSRRQLEEELGWGADSVKRIERGERAGGVSVDELVALAYALSVAPIALLAPWDDDVLTVEGQGLTHQLTTQPAMEWLAGLPPTPGGGLHWSIDYRAYFAATPLDAMSSGGRKWLEQVARGQLPQHLDEGGQLRTPADGPWFLVEEGWKRLDDLSGPDREDAERLIAAKRDRRRAAQAEAAAAAEAQLEELPADHPARLAIEASREQRGTEPTEGDER